MKSWPQRWRNFIAAHYVRLYYSCYKAVVVVADDGIILVAVASITVTATATPFRPAPAPAFARRAAPRRAATVASRIVTPPALAADRPPLNPSFSLTRRGEA